MGSFLLFDAGRLAAGQPGASVSEPSPDFNNAVNATTDPFSLRVFRTQEPRARRRRRPSPPAVRPADVASRYVWSHRVVSLESGKNIKRTNIGATPSVPTRNSDGRWTPGTNNGFGTCGAGSQLSRVGVAMAHHRHNGASHTVRRRHPVPRLRTPPADPTILGRGRPSVAATKKIRRPETVRLNRETGFRQARTGFKCFRIHFHQPDSANYSTRKKLQA